MQGEDNNAEQWYAATAVAYHRDQKIQLGGGLIGTERAVNLMSARAIQSAISLTTHSRRMASEGKTHSCHLRLYQER